MSDILFFDAIAESVSPLATMCCPLVVGIGGTTGGVGAGALTVGMAGFGVAGLLGSVVGIAGATGAVAFGKAGDTIPLKAVLIGFNKSENGYAIYLLYHYC